MVAILFEPSELVLYFNRLLDDLEIGYERNNFSAFVNPPISSVKSRLRILSEK